MATPKLTANKFIPQLHTPSWGWARQAPVVSAAGSASCSAKNSIYHPYHGRFIYYLFNSTNFWKYDTVTDGWTQLSSPAVGTATYSSLTFRGDSGVVGNVLAATSSTVRLPTVASNKGYETFEIQITGGTGIGQRRVISAQSAIDIADSGTPTAVATGSILTITDSTKSWTINQWRGYTVRIINSTGVFQFRRILYNDATSITVAAIGKTESDINAFPAAFSPVLTTTAGSQSLYQIESTVCTVEDNWSTTPDETSRFEVRTGLIHCISGAASSWTSQVYSVAEDLWYYRSGYTGLLAASPTDGSIETPDETWSVLWNSKATAGTTTSLTDSNANWVTNEWADRWLFIFSGTSSGTLVKVISNTQTVLTFSTVSTAPDATSRYKIWSLASGTVTTGNTDKTLTDASVSFESNRYAGAYQVRIVAGTGIGQVRRIISNTGTVLTLDKPITTSTDTVYQIQPDASTAYLMFSLNAEVLRYGVDHDVVYRGVEYDYGVIAGGTAKYADDRPISISSGTVVSSVCTILTNVPHGFKTGYSITHSGDTGASAAQNNITATITVTGASSYTYPVPGSSAHWTIGGQSTTTLRDASKNWVTNEHAGRLVTITGLFAATGQTPVANIAQIASNTANTLTFVSAVTAPVVGNRYCINGRAPIGSLVDGIATGTQSTTTLQDTTKTWTTNQFAGRFIRFLGGAGTQAITALITSNTNNLLIFGATTAPINGATPYSILSQPARGVGFELTIPFNTSVVGDDCRYLYSPRGGAAIGWDIFDLTTGTHRPMLVGQSFETLSTGSMFVYDGGNRIYFTKDVTNRCYYLDLSDGQIYSAPQIPYVAGTAIVGNRMDIVTTIDRLKILYVNRHSNIEFFKTLLWY
jgi:hypothetical protein